MHFRLKASAIAAGLILSLSGAGATLAQGTDGPVATPDQSMAAAPMDFSQEQIDAFAVAYVQVMQIGMTFEQEVQAAGSEDEAMELQSAAQQDMVAAVEQTEGISVLDYNSLLTAAQADPALAEQVQAAVDEIVAQPGETED